MRIACRSFVHFSAAFVIPKDLYNRPIPDAMTDSIRADFRQKNLSTISWAETISHPPVEGGASSGARGGRSGQNVT